MSEGEGHRSRAWWRWLEPDYWLIAAGAVTIAGGGGSLVVQTALAPLLLTFAAGWSAATLRWLVRGLSAAVAGALYFSQMEKTVEASAP